MKKLLIISLSLITFFGYSQTLIDPTLTPTTARINAALSDAVAASGTDTYTGTKSGLTNVTGKAYSVTFANNNTGASTFNLNATSAIEIRKFESGSLVPLVDGDISDGETKRLRYNGTYLVIEGGSGSGGGGITDLTGDVTASGTGSVVATIASGVIVDADVNASAAIAGTKIANTPAGNIAATNVQTAINELDTEKQATLVSATNIKTINGSTILGSGDLSVGGGTAASLAEMLAGTNDTKTVTPLKNSYVNKRFYNVEAYGAVHDGRYLQGGLSITAASSTVTTSDGATPFVVGDVGKIILIPGAGAAGVTLKTTIATYISSSSVTISVAASTSVSGKYSFFGTDDTAAIQAANDACYAAGGGVVYFPNGTYCINGALQTSVGGSNPNCQLYFKSHAANTATVKVEWVGESAVFSTQETTNPVNGVILFSTLTASSGLNPAVIGVIGASGNYYDFTFDEINIESIGVRVWTNQGITIPVVSGLNLRFAGNLSLIRILVSGEYDRTVSPTPVGSGRFGIWASSINNFCLGKMENCSVRGAFEYGVIYGEHLIFNNVGVNGCYYGHTFLRSGHPGTGKILSQGNNTQIYIPNTSTFLGYDHTLGNAMLNILSLETEINIDSKWYDTQYLIRDAGNLAYGLVRFNASSIANTNTLFSTIIATECTNLNITKMTSLLSNQVNQAGGQVTQWGQVGSEPIVEIGSSTAATSGGDYSGVLGIASNQSNTSAAPVGRIQFLNKVATQKRGAQIRVDTDGSTTDYKYRMFVQRGGTVTESYNVDAYINALVAFKPRAGTTAANTAPIKYTSGTLNTTIETGTREYNNSHYMSTNALNRLGVGGKIADFSASVNNTSTTETDLFTYTTKASTLIATGEEIEFTGAGTFNDLTSTSQLKFYFAGSSIGDTGALTVSALGGFVWRVVVKRTGSGTVSTSVTVNTSGTSTTVYTAQTDLSGLTLSGTNIVKITGTAAGASGGSNDITAKIGKIMWYPAAAN